MERVKRVQFNFSLDENEAKEMRDLISSGWRNIDILRKGIAECKRSTLGMKLEVLK